MKSRNLSSCMALAIAFGTCMFGVASAAASQGAPSAIARKTGTVKSISGNTIALKTDSGEDVAITVQENARILRVEPGQTDLKSAAPMALTDIQPGDRLLARGHQGESTGTLTAAAIIVMKSGDVAEKQQKEMQDWQRRGTGGIVSALDASAGTVTVSVTPTMSVVVRTGRNTKFLRYAAGSIKFADALPSTFDQIKVGDQLRARGAHSADGKELAAEEVISGTFRNIAGTISGIDAGASTVTVKDILGKKTVTVKLTADSQMRKLPPQLAQRIAFFLKSPEAAQAGMGRRMNAGGPGARPGGGGGDFQQIINRLPAVTLGDLQKEEAVMIVSTPGTGGREVTAITLLSGVEPILTSNASGAAALLNGWNLSAPSGDGGPQ